MFNRGLFSKRAYRLNEVREDDTGKFGEKACTLARLTRLKLPVPDAFVIVSEARDINSDRLSIPDSLKKQIKQQIEHLESSTGRHFFTAEESESGAMTGGEGVESAKFPLLLSVRQSSKHGSTPLFPTSLNLGFNAEVAARALKLSNRPLFVYDCWRRFIQDFGIHVLGISSERYSTIADDLCRDWGIPKVSQASISQLKELVRSFNAITPIPQDPFRQVVMTVEAILRHHCSIGSSVFRTLQGGVEDSGIAVIIQSQVFSNLTMLSSGYGSAYSRILATGEPVSEVGMSGIYHSRAEGGDEVLSGSREISLFKELRVLQPALYNELVRTVQTVEQDYAAIVRVDFLVENGQAYVIHATPTVASTPHATMRALVDFTTEDASLGTGPLLSHRQAVRRLDPTQMPSGEHELWTTDDNAHKLLRWAKHMRQDLTTLGVLAEVGSMRDMQKGVQLFADSFGVIHLQSLLGAYFPEELVDASSPAKTAGERSLALHSLRIKLAAELCTFLVNACQVRAGGGWPSMDVEGSGETESVAVGGQLQRQTDAVDAESKHAQADSGRCSGPGDCDCSSGPCNPQHPCDLIPSVTIMLCEEMRGREATPAFLHPDYLQMQAHAATEALLKSAANMCLCCDDCTCCTAHAGEAQLQQQGFQPCKVELNLAVPFGLAPEELACSLLYVQAGVTAAEEDFDLQTIGSIVDDIPATSSGSGLRRAKDRLEVHIGVEIGTPQGCFNARAIASKPPVDFVIINLDSLTASALGKRLDPDLLDGESGTAVTDDAGYRVRRQQAMRAMMHQNLLARDPYQSVEASCVMPMVAKCAESARKAAAAFDREIKILVRGAPARDPYSLEQLSAFVDAVILPPVHLPTPLFASADMGGDKARPIGGLRASASAPALGTSLASPSQAPRDDGLMSPVKGAISSMFENAKSGMRDLFQEEEEPFYFIA